MAACITAALDDVRCCVFSFCLKAFSDDCEANARRFPSLLPNRCTTDISLSPLFVNRRLGFSTRWSATHRRLSARIRFRIVSYDDLRLATGWLRVHIVARRLDQTVCHQRRAQHATFRLSLFARASGSRCVSRKRTNSYTQPAQTFTSIVVHRSTKYKSTHRSRRYRLYFVTYFPSLRLPLCLEWNNGSYIWLQTTADRPASQTRLHLRLGAWVNVLATAVGHRVSCLCTVSCDPLSHSRHSIVNIISD